MAAWSTTSPYRNVNTFLEECINDSVRRCGWPWSHVVLPERNQSTRACCLPHLLVLDVACQHTSTSTPLPSPIVAWLSVWGPIRGWAKNHRFLTSVLDWFGCYVKWTMITVWVHTVLVVCAVQDSRCCAWWGWKQGHWHRTVHLSLLHQEGFSSIFPGRGYRPYKHWTSRASGSSCVSYSHCVQSLWPMSTWLYNKSCIVMTCHVGCAVWYKQQNAVSGRKRTHPQN